MADANTPAYVTTDPVSHTPGPWSVEEPLDFELTIVEADKPTHEWKFIASVPTTPEFDFPPAVAKANAHLIAAAPDLLAACRRLRSVINDHVSLADVDALDAAIAKAEGRS